MVDRGSKTAFQNNYRRNCKAQLTPAISVIIFSVISFPPIRRVALWRKVIAFLKSPSDTFTRYDSAWKIMSENAKPNVHLIKIQYTFSAVILKHQVVPKADCQSQAQYTSYKTTSLLTQMCAGSFRKKHSLTPVHSAENKKPCSLASVFSGGHFSGFRTT